MVRNLFGSAAVGPEIAARNADRIIDLERWLGLYIEADVQEAFIGWTAFIQFWNLFYGLFHFLVTFTALIWVYVQFPDRYRFWRRAGLVATTSALVGFAAFPLMPPRLLGDCGTYGACRAGERFVDTVLDVGGIWSFESSGLEAVSNQYAAMPSLHIGWALWCALMLVPLLTSTWAKALAAVYPVLTLFAIVVTANHYWIDGVGGAVVVAFGLAVSRRWDAVVRPCTLLAWAVVLLNQITQPADLRRLSMRQLDELCQELRDTILAAVAEQGGHLGSNLGIVELTVALHRTFDSPHDVLLFDTGHQAYVHKMLTGRADHFESLRETGGLSGYPSQTESAHDWIENSHASTAMSYAHGLATAFMHDDENTRKIVAVIGDGSMTGGMAFEGLNNLGHGGSDVTIVLNDNGRSYAPTVSKLGESLARLRVNPRFVRQQSRVERIIGDVPIVGREVERALDAAKAAVREMWEPTSFFENLGVRYTGPFDGHDIAGLEAALANAAEIDGPVVVHVVTQKGRGYAPAENDPVKRMHDTGPFGATTSSVSGSSAPPRGKYTAAFSEALVKAGERVPELVALTAAMPDSTGLLPFAERFPDRAFDVGIAEQHAVTSAAGMAMGGLRPVVAIYSSFLTRAIDQVMLDVGLHKLPVIFCVDRSGVTGPDGPSGHGVADMVLLTKVPGLTMLAPSSYQEVQVMLDDALELTDGPVAIRWPRTTARMVTEHEVGSGLSARQIAVGTDVCVLAVGKMVEVAEAAVAELLACGVSATLYDVRCVKPLDPAMLADAGSHRLVITIEDGLAAGGAGSMIAAHLGELDAPPRVQVMGLPDSYLPHGDPDELLAMVGLDARGIVDAVQRLR
nr:1-deoxy-D-xylulose-5-phosphate synthase-like [Nerophis lumbriciformis]